MGAFLQDSGQPPIFPDVFITVALEQENVDTRHVFGGSATEHFDLTHPSSPSDGPPLALGLSVFGGGGADLFILPADGKADLIKDYDTQDDCLDLRVWEVSDLSQLTLTEHRSGKLIVSFEDEAVVLGGWSNPIAASQLTADQIIFSDVPFKGRDLNSSDAVNGWLVGTNGDDTIGATGAPLKIFGGAGADSFFVFASGLHVQKILDFDPSEDTILLGWFGVRGMDQLDITQLSGGKVVVKSAPGPSFVGGHETLILGSADHPVDATELVPAENFLFFSVD